MGERNDSQTDTSATPTVAATQVEPPSGKAPASSWMKSLDRVVRMHDCETSQKVRAALSCDISEDHQTLYVPPEMSALQPRSLRYLSAFAMRNNFKMVEDRRQTRVSPINEQRDGKPPTIALGVARLLKQTGLPGATATLSRPHRLAAENPLIDLPALIGMSAQAAPTAKKVVLLPNKSLVDVLDNETVPITGLGCIVDSAQTRTLLTQFHGDSLRCIGYSSGSQYVVHVLLGGGPVTAPTLWTQAKTLTRTDVRFRLFSGADHTEDFGLMYSTFYYDMPKQTPSPWWLNQQSEASEVA